MFGQLKKMDDSEHDNTEFKGETSVCSSYQKREHQRKSIIDIKKTNQKILSSTEITSVLNALRP